MADDDEPGADVIEALAKSRSLAELATSEYRFVEERPLGLSLSDRDEDGRLFANGQVVIWQVHEGEAAHALRHARERR